MGFKFDPSRWMNRNQGKTLGLVASAFVSMIFVSTSASIRSDAVLHVVQCRAPAYVGSGYYLATIQSADGRIFSVGSEHNAHDHAAKLEAYNLVVSVCTGEPVAIGYVQANDYATPEIIAARALGG